MHPGEAKGEGPVGIDGPSQLLEPREPLPSSLQQPIESPDQPPRQSRQIRPLGRQPMASPGGRDKPCPEIRDPLTPLLHGT